MPITCLIVICIFSFAKGLPRREFVNCTIYRFNVFLNKLYEDLKYFIGFKLSIIRLLRKLLFLKVYEKEMQLSRAVH